MHYLYHGLTIINQYHHYWWSRGVMRIVFRRESFTTWANIAALLHWASWSSTGGRGKTFPLGSPSSPLFLVFIILWSVLWVSPRWSSQAWVAPSSWLADGASGRWPVSTVECSPKAGVGNGISKSAAKALFAPFMIRPWLMLKWHSTEVVGVYTVFEQTDGMDGPHFPRLVPQDTNICQHQFLEEQMIYVRCWEAWH